MDGGGERISISGGSGAGTEGAGSHVEMQEQSSTGNTNWGEPPGIVSRKSTPRQMRRMDSLELESLHVTGMENHADKLFTLQVTLRLAFQTIGVVYGDVGTSPLYVYSSTFPDGIDTQHTEKNVLGALSLIIYTLTLIPLLKYVFVVLRANDQGEGGTFALYSLISRHAKVTLMPNQNSEARKLSAYQLDFPKRMKSSTWVKQKLETSRVAQVVLLLLALVGTCMVIGDGILTPAISVLSAVEGIQVQATSLSQNVIVAISCVILVLLFSVQHFGTDKVGFTFAPCVFVWFMFIGIIGIYNIFKHDAGIFRAFNPKYIIDYFKINKKKAWTSLGGVVLCITGTEAMFADLGHFSVRAIQIGFTSVVYPCLLAAYIGQAAYLLKHPENVGQTFYKSIPNAVYWPQFVIAVIAAIIASQAMISATFSIIKQSVALGCFPRVKIIHTSKKYVGQIYIPELNWFLMVACLIITAAYKNTNQIGNAYGICVVMVMLITTSLVTIVMLMIWQTKIFMVLAFSTIFGCIELLYLTSVLEKFTKGGWLPLLFASIFLTIMITWYYGNVTKYKYDVQNVMPIESFTREENLGTKRIPGVGLVYTEVSQGVPGFFSHFLSSLSTMHSVIVFVSVKHFPVANVLNDERFVFRRVGRKRHHIYRCIARYGYQDEPEENVTFEHLLFEWLAHFIKSEMMETESSPENAQPHMDGATNITIYPSKVQPLDSSLDQQVNVIESDNIDEELLLITKAKEDGIIYILGQSDIEASKGSPIFKKILINYFFNFLRLNFRQSTISLDIPNKKLLKVGMSYQI